MRRKSLCIVALVALAVPVALSIDETKKEWAASAQKSIYEVSVVFDRASFSLSSVDSNMHGKLFALSTSTAKIAGAFGVFGALFSIAMAFIPGSESPELKLMRSEFDKLSQKVDAIAESLKGN